MAYWAGGGAGGWSQGNTPNQRRGRGSQVDMINRRGIDGWDYDELGKVYDLGLIKRLLPFITPHKWKALGAIISMIIFSAASYAPPFIMALAIERIGSAIIEGTPESFDRAVADTQFFGIVVVVLAVVMFFAAMAQRLFTGYIGHHMLRDLRSDMFAHLNILSLCF